MTPCEEPKVRVQTSAQKRKKARGGSGEVAGGAGRERMQEEEDGKEGRSHKRKGGFREKLDGGGGRVE